MRKQPSYILTNPSTGRHLYGRGWLGLIPLIGFFVGIGLFTLGLVRYRDKKLMIIGIAAMASTLVFYGGLYFYFNYSSSAAKLQASISQMHLNDLVKEVEFFKIQNGVYPDSIVQLLPNLKGKPIFIEDPISTIKGGKPYMFNYKKIDSGYILYSAGIDKVDKTTDDIYPTIDLRNTGFISIK